MKSESKKYVIYVRCSTDDQSRGDFTTLDAQAQHCKNMLDVLGFTTSRVIKDDGYSGKDLKRPGIQSILSEIGSKNKKPTFDGIIFLRLDRLTRNTRDLYALMDLFKENGIDFISVRENIDSSSPIGRVMIGMLGSLAAFEREQIGERVKASAIARARAGRWCGGKLPYGYSLIKSGDPLPDGRQQHKIIVDAHVGPKIKLIWGLAAQNKSVLTIARELEKNGLRSATGKNWRVQSILTILRNPFYYGHMRWAGELHAGGHEALIDKTTWDKANRIVSANLPGHRFIKKPKNYRYLLEGLIQCGSCGSQMITKYSLGRSGKLFFYYLCSRQSHGLGCDAQQLSATAFDDAVIAYFKDSSKDQRMIIGAIEKAVEDARIRLTSADKEINKIEKNLKKAKEEAEKLMDLALQGTIGKGSTYRARIEKMEAEIDILEQSLSRLRAQKKAAEMASDSGNFIHSTIVFAMKKFDQAAPEAQKALFKALIKEIVVHQDKIELRMFIGNSTEENIPQEIPQPHESSHQAKKKRPTLKSEAFNGRGNGSPLRQDWLPRVGSNHGQAR